MEKKFAQLESRYEIMSMANFSGCHAAQALENATGMPVTIKYIPLRERRLLYRGVTLDEGEARLISIREILTLRQLAHCNVARLKAVLAMDEPPPLSEIYLVVEYGSTPLANILKERRLDSDIIRVYAYQLFCGLHYLHSARIVHGYIYPGNVIINEKELLKLTDFGLAQYNQHGRGDEPEEMLPSFNYSAPEKILAPRRSSYASDVFSCGCLLAEMLGSTQLFSSESYSSHLVAVVAVLGTPDDEDLAFCTNEEAIAFLGKLPRWYRTLWRLQYPGREDCAIELLDGCLKFHPRKRINAHTALVHKLFDSIRDQSKERPMSVETYVVIQAEANLKCTNTMDQIEELIDDFI